MDLDFGKKLRDARIEKELTLEEISSQLHIRTAYLQALEAGRLDQLPSLTQARGFARSYAKFLELDDQAISESKPAQAPQDREILEEDVLEASSIERDESHQVIFEEIGKAIRQRRDIIGLSKEDIEAHTHIPAHYVDYIETGDFDSFPSPAQSRGMLNNYLQFLEFNPDELMNRYAEALQIRLSKQQEILPEAESQSPIQPAPKKEQRTPQWVRMFLSPDLILVTFVGIIVVGLTIWGIGRITRTQSEIDPQPTAPSLVEALLPTATSAPTSTQPPQDPNNGTLLEVESPESDEPTLVPTFQVAPGASLEIFIIVRQRTYLRISADGEVVFDGRTTPGSNLTYAAQDEISILTGNAAALQIYFNDQDQGIIGIFGEVAELIFTKDGVIRPTKVPTPTPVVTETPIVTPEPNPTEAIDLPPEENTPVP